jgi:hypothetical protein
MYIDSVSDVRQIEIHTAEPIVPDPSPFEVEIAIRKLVRNKSPSSNQIPAELIQAGGETLRSEIHQLINSICNKEKLSDQRKEYVIVPIHKKGDKTDCSNCGLPELILISEGLLHTHTHTLSLSLHILTKILSIFTEWT